MGTKRHLAGVIGRICELSKPGPLLDVFSGMCAVGIQLAPFRQIWTNDAQLFAHEFATALFCSRELPPNAEDFAHNYSSRFRRLKARFAASISDEMRSERDAIEHSDLAGMQLHFESSIKRAQDARNNASIGPISAIYSGTYFSVEQSCEIDAIRALISDLTTDALLTTEQSRWLIVALGIAADRVANTTGHFAQALNPKEGNIARILKQRKRNVWFEWLTALSGLSPVKTSSWRRRNRSFNCDAIELLQNLASDKSRPGVIYADPPYTKDQYSRYYGLLDTIVRHDRPQVSGRGLTRLDGFKSSFSMSSRIEASLTNLVRAAAEIEADLILSYPSDALCKNAKEVLYEIARETHGTEPTIIAIPHAHSTLGASTGAARNAVEEHLYRIAA